MISQAQSRNSLITYPMYVLVIVHGHGPTREIGIILRGGIDSWKDVSRWLFGCALNVRG